jgi:phosphatidylserine/phosphatidylglycerophosphate/cardiolipin synthase-like enzyme
MKLYIKIITILFVLGLSITLNILFQETREDYLKEDNLEKNLIEDNFITENINQKKYSPIKEKINAYFCPDENSYNVLENLIDNTQKSIYCAVYDISSREVYNKLIEKENIDIKIVTDLERSKSVNSLVGQLKTKGVVVIESPLTSKLMHNKFCVFDEEITLVGSMNFTENCLYKNNNDFLVIEDKQIANFFTEKIKKYFQGYFYSNQERYLLQEEIEIYFCPDNDCEQIILDVFRNVESSIDCMYFTFTLNDALYELQENSNYKNIQTRIILEKRNISEYSVYDYLQEINIPVILDNNPNTMHNKFCVVDDSYVVTGSLNLTQRGPTNEETLIFLYDEDIVEKYSQYFKKYWNTWNN